MRLGLYIFSAILLIASVGAFAFTTVPQEYTLVLFKHELTLPVALWLIAPALVLFFFSALHIFYYGTKQSFIIRRWSKDAKRLEKGIYSALANEPKKLSYANKEFDAIASMLSCGCLDAKSEPAKTTQELQQLQNIISRIKSGEYIDLKALKLHKLFSNGNPILMQNRLNRLEIDEKFIEEVIKSHQDYMMPVRKKAVELFVQKADFVRAKPLAKLLEKKDFFALLERATSDQPLGFSADIAKHFSKQLEFDCADFIKLAQKSQELLTPIEALELFKKLQEDSSKAQNSYLFLMFEYEYIDAINAFLDEQEEDEFVKFRAILKLKEIDSSYSLKTLYSPSALC